MLQADPSLIACWAHAWAISRGAQTPVARHGGLYIHVDQPDQIGRYVFASADVDSIRPLAATIEHPLLFLKVCAPADLVRPMLPRGWDIATPGYMMSAPLTVMLDRAPAVSPEFAIDMTSEGSITFVHILDAAGEEAARGRVIAMGDLAVFDRIRTAEHYQRRGLGSAVMRALASAAEAQGIRDAMLCATPAGRELYTALGWTMHSDYTTASAAAPAKSSVPAPQ